jgi:hypothetical protein
LALAWAAKAGLGGKLRFSWERFSIESPLESPVDGLLITQQITREYQQAEGFSDVAKQIEGMIADLQPQISMN